MTISSNLHHTGSQVGEIEQPNKRKFAETIANQCYFVTPHGLVDPSEVPENWGLMWAQSSRVIKKKTAKHTTREQWPMPFIAALARRSNDGTVKPYIAKYHGDEVSDEELLEIAEKVGMRKIEQRRREIEREAVEKFKKKPSYQNDQKTLEAIQELTGLHLGWNGPQKFNQWYQDHFGQELPRNLRIELRHIYTTIGKLLDAEESS